MKKIVIGATYVLGGGITLQVRLDGLVLLVEEGQIRDEILDDVGVRQWVDARLGVGLGGDTAWSRVSKWLFQLMIVHSHAIVGNLGSGVWG